MMQAALDLTVLRSGVPDTVPGRSLNVCERGIAAIVAKELIAGESVGVELQMPPFPEPLRTRALVRYQDRLRCGLEFVALTPEQRASIRDWAREAQAMSEEISPAAVASPVEQERSEPPTEADLPVAYPAPAKAKPQRRRVGRLIAAVVIFGAVIWWWRWNRAWQDLEFGVRSSRVSAAEKPRAQVPAEVMQRLLVHRVEPVYPAGARKERLEGTIALDIVIGRDGSVLSMHALNGPEILAGAAMDALRWWKFEPYRINGKPEVVETTVAVEFKR
jgi:TonB family protein